MSPAFTTAIGILPGLNRRRRDLWHQTPEVSGGTDYSDGDGFERPEVSQVRSENTEPDPVSEHSDPAEPIHDSVIPLDSASEQIKKLQERSRRRRRPFPEPPVPTFVMVSPGRYIRAEEPAPSSVAATGEAAEDNPTPETLDTADDITIPAAESIPEVGDGPANGGFGSPGSSDVDPAGGTGIEDPLVEGPSCDEETVDGSEEGCQSEADRLAMPISRSWRIAESGRCSDPGGDLSPG